MQAVRDETERKEKRERKKPKETRHTAKRNKSEKGAFWSFDTTLNAVGKQRLPNTANNPEEFQIQTFLRHTNLKHRILIFSYPLCMVYQIVY